MIYHLLLETEVFSAYRGGAVARTIANIMRLDESSVVVCADWDDTWGYGRDRVLLIPGLRVYASIKGRRFLPPSVTGPGLRHIFQPLISRVGPDDTVWCHSQSHFSAALEKTIHLKKAKLIHQADSSIGGYANRTVFRRFTPDAFIFVSEAMRREALGLFPWLKNTYVIHNGADEARFYPQPLGSVRGDAVPTILYVGRLVPEKGVHVLMKAMKILQQRNISVFCKVVGSSYAGRSKPTRYVKALHKYHPSNVQFEGFYSGTDIASVYRIADIFCCPSIYQEPFGNVNIEAMASGIPVVATRVGGIPEIASEGGVVLVEPDSATALADALQILVEDKHLRESLGTEGIRSFHKRFKYSIICEKYQEVITRLTHMANEA